MGRLSGEIREPNRKDKVTRFPSVSYARSLGLLPPQGFRPEDRKSRRDRLGRFCDIYCAVILRYVLSVTFCGAVVLNVMDQKTLVKRRWSYKLRNVYI